MDLIKNKWIGFAIICCSIVWASKNWLLHKFWSESDRVDLLIGIMSSRSNFEQRETIRQTWKNHSALHESSQIRAVFVIGEENCPIHPDDRLDINSCEEWNISSKDTEDLVDNKLKVTCEVQETSSVPLATTQMIYKGFSFLTHHPIVVKKLGILSSLNEKSKNITIALIDAVTEAEITSIKISPLKHGIPLNGYHYFSVEPMLLPKGFEAIIIVKGIHQNLRSELLINTWNDPRKFFSYTQLYKNAQNNIIVKHFSQATSATSFAFSVHDIQLLKKHIKGKKHRQKKWAAIMEKERITVIEEMLKHGDLVKVDVIDIYRNLPQKMLYFYQSVSSASDYIMKTDDDTFINVEVLLKEFKKIQKLQEKLLWWSSFRYNWLVDRIGKWRELEYSAAVYPPFACGSGNVLSHDLVNWLSINYKNLHSFQGEDVSLGIWLAALGPTYFNDPKWYCEDFCDKNSYNIAQLTPLEMKTIWKNIQMCNNPCTCNG